MYRFLVVEDHALVRESMVGLLRQMEEVFGQMLEIVS